MKNFDLLISTLEELFNTNGCPWVKKQTLSAAYRFLIEEAHEAAEAIQNEDNKAIKEELGDLLFTAIFAAYLAQKENRFTLAEMLEGIKDKVIRRHPHVFSDVGPLSEEEVKLQWLRIKKEEGKIENNLFPPSLPLLTRAKKVIEKMVINNLKLPIKNSLTLGERFLELLYEGEKEGLDCEKEIRQALSLLEKNKEK